MFNSIGSVSFTIRHKGEEPTLQELLDGWNQRLRDFKEDGRELTDALFKCDWRHTYTEGDW